MKQIVLFSLTMSFLLAASQAAFARVHIESNLVLPADSGAPALDRDAIRRMPLVTAEGQYVAVPIVDLSLEQLGALNTTAGSDSSLSDDVAVPSTMASVEIIHINNMPASAIAYTYRSGIGVNATVPNTGQGMVQNAINTINAGGLIGGSGEAMEIGHLHTGGGAGAGAGGVGTGGAVIIGAGAGGSVTGGVGGI